MSSNIKNCKARTDATSLLLTNNKACTDATSDVIIRPNPQNNAY